MSFLRSGLQARFGRLDNSKLLKKNCLHYLHFELEGISTTPSQSDAFSFKIHPSIPGPLLFTNTEICPENRNPSEDT
jgi:hypothetical protein